MRRTLVPAAVALVGCLAGLGLGRAAAPASVSRKVALSLGAPNAGRLENGAHLDPRPYLRLLPAYAIGDAHWGVRELVDGIDRAAREVHKRYPDAVLGVGQLSRKGGGEIDRHHSHESGRDADLGFYLVDALGRSVQRAQFFSIRPDGYAGSDPRLRFDEGRNWALIAALLNDPRARVTHVFVATWLRTRLLAYGARVGASPALRARVAETLMQPHHALPHDDHFHVRIACPPSSTGCIEAALATTTKRPATKDAVHRSKAPTRKLSRARATGRIEASDLAPGRSIETWPTPGE